MCISLRYLANLRGLLPAAFRNDKAYGSERECRTNIGSLLYAVL